MFFCLVSITLKGQKILLADSTQEIISKRVTVDYILSIPTIEDAIEGFPKKIFAITDCLVTITLKGSPTKHVTLEDYMGIHGMLYPFQKQLDFAPKPGMKVRIERIHVIKKAGATGDIAPIPITEFILTE
jgi:hypothetical protein